MLKSCFIWPCLSQDLPPPQNKIKGKEVIWEVVWRGDSSGPGEAARTGLTTGTEQSRSADPRHRLLAARSPRSGSPHRSAPPRPRTPPGPWPSSGQSCANSPDDWQILTGRGGTRGCGGFTEFRAAGPRGRRAKARGRGLQLTARGARLGCAETLRLCQGLRCNKGLPLPHSRACRTALSRPRLRGDSGSAHQFAAASASLPLPLARPPTPPLAARGTRGRLLVATSFCVGLGRLALPAARAPGRRLEQHSRPSPLGRLGPPPVCTAGRHWDPPDSPGAGC